MTDRDQLGMASRKSWEKECENHAAKLLEVHADFNRKKEKLTQKLEEASNQVNKEHTMWMVLSREADKKVCAAEEKTIEYRRERRQ